MRGSTSVIRIWRLDVRFWRLKSILVLKGLTLPLALFDILHLLRNWLESHNQWLIWIALYNRPMVKLSWLSHGNVCVKYQNVLLTHYRHCIWSLTTLKYSWINHMAILFYIFSEGVNSESDVQKSVLSYRSLERRWNPNHTSMAPW